MPIEIVNPDDLPSAALLPAGFTANSPLLAAPGGDYAKAYVFDSQTLDDAGFSVLSLTAGGPDLGVSYQAITEDAGAALSVQPNGTITLTGAGATINGALTARGGAINITTDIADFTPNDILIGTGAVLDVSGFFSMSYCCRPANPHRRCPSMPVRFLWWPGPHQ